MVRLKDFEQWNDSYAIKGYNPDLRSALLKELKLRNKRAKFLRMKIKEDIEDGNDFNTTESLEADEHEAVIDFLTELIEPTREELEVQE